MSIKAPVRVLAAVLTAISVIAVTTTVAAAPSAPDGVVLVADPERCC